MFLFGKADKEIHFVLKDLQETGIFFYRKVIDIKNNYFLYFLISFQLNKIVS